MNDLTLLPALGVAAALATGAGAALGWAAGRLRANPGSLADRIDALLPQTQCGQCRYPGCRPYAAAIAAGEADIDRCPPGGEATVRALAALLGREPRAVDPRYGATKPRLVAVIDEERCVGCALCLPACPVDAIVGAHRFVHTVLEDACTGCELCLPPCPVDCIELRTPGGNPSSGAAHADAGVAGPAAR
jgi:electron transport complex protein RnfB